MIAGRRIVHSGGDRGWPGDVPRFRRHISRLQALGWQPIGSASPSAATGARLCSITGGRGRRCADQVAPLGEIGQ
jgi:hypothetical protein